MQAYKITNAVNGKIYIGQHKGDNLKQYLQKKFYAAKKHPELRSHLYAAMRKHGRENFSIEPIARVHGAMPKVVLDSLETFLIAFFDSRNPEVGYNICRGGEGFTGTPWNKGLKTGIAPWLGKKRPDIGPVVAAAHRGTRASAETRAKMSASRMGRKPSANALAALAERNKGNKYALARGCTHLGQTPWNKGKRASAETRQRLSEAHKGKPWSEARRAAQKSSYSKHQ